MKLALEEAQKAYVLGEVPIGAVIVQRDQIIAQAHNLRHTSKSPLAHAEILSIEAAARVIGDWRLEDCTLYVTLEPCPMCAGAILQSRIPRLIIATMDPKAGAVGSLLNLLQDQRFNHQVQIEYGILQQECTQILKDFFKELRAKKKSSKSV